MLVLCLYASVLYATKKCWWDEMHDSLPNIAFEEESTDCCKRIDALIKYSKIVASKNESVREALTNFIAVHNELINAKEEAQKSQENDSAFWPAAGKIIKLRLSFRQLRDNLIGALIAQTYVEESVTKGRGYLKNFIVGKVITQRDSHVSEHKPVPPAMAVVVEAAIKRETDELNKKKDKLTEVVGDIQNATDSEGIIKALNKLKTVE
jgi:hypothetical protein